MRDVPKSRIGGRTGTLPAEVDAEFALHQAGADCVNLTAILALIVSG
jgi:hypothetical protein